AESRSVVAHQHPLFLDEAISDSRTQPRADLSRVGERSVTALSRRCKTAEEQLQRKRSRVRMFVVREDALVFRIVGRGINLIADLAAGRRPFAVLHHVAA